MKLILVIMGFFAIPSFASATTYYSDPAGGNFNGNIWSTSSAGPFTTASTAITSSDDIFVQGGILTLNLASNSTYCRNLTIQNGATVKIQGTAARNCTFTGDITVQSGGIFQVGDAPSSVITVPNVFVNTGGKLWSNLLLNSSANNIVYFFITGTQLVCDGVIGNGSTSDALAFQPEGANVIFSGLGIFDCTRIRKTTTTNTTSNLTIQVDINLRLGAANLTNGANSTTFNVTIDQGKTVKLVAGYFPTGGLADIGLDGGTGTSNRRQGTYTINGNLECENLYITANNAACLSTDAYKMVIGSTGAVTVRSQLIGNGAASFAGSGLAELQMQSGGLLKLHGATATSLISTAIAKNKWTFDNASTIDYANTGSQTIENNFGNYGNLKISVSGTKTVAGTITVNGLLSVNAGMLSTGANALSLGTSATAIFSPATTLSVDASGSVDFNGRSVTLQSSAAGTGRISQINGTLSGATNVTTQIFIPSGKRAYRFLGHPFSSTLNMGSLIDNIFITGDGTAIGAGGSTVYGAGFDSTATNTASTYWYDNTSSAWKAFASTVDNSWLQYRGIRALVRGDRSQGTALTGGNPTPNAVTLDMTGTLNIGLANIAIPTAGGFHLVSNPYPSSTDIGTVIDGLTSAVIGNQYWIWDANASSPNNRGAYVTKLVGSGAYNLAMNGAFFVKPVAATTLAFTESNKQASATTGLFRTSAVQDLLELNVLYNNGQADNLFVRHSATALAATEAEDGMKLLNPDINFYALSSSTTKLSLDSRPIQPVTIIPLGFTTTVPATFSIAIANNTLNALVAIYIKDKLLNTEQLLTAASLFTFTVTTDAATQGEGRFELVFRNNGALPATLLNLSAAEKNAGIELSWNTANETNMQSYDVEKSADGTTFVKSATITAKNTVSNIYQWFDGNIINGDNYYRIKSIEKNGTTKYSSIVNVKIRNRNPGFTVYPNPIKAGVINLQISNMKRSSYTIKLFNNNGQELASRTIIHNGGTATQSITIGSSIPAGNYNMQVLRNATPIVTKSVIVE